ncbi:carboxypeptidase-like regulatory domain-containing protein [Chryseosolibacter indicus]|uniref:Carboxypeptidase regulatory-like domain-containing protein n=1 Tax=Chryseosolibacter indicus TaxID=2782351 RepID=A0ABS5VM17_9BACT|nr:carboxypeptidase-like regulatory domain-containing protein [Chryseosolibacter indicus]MBT1702498.1 carboxypeptidase regulatory-like domain-containing protein [Chryseosolibacter indicus]
MKSTLKLLVIVLFLVATTAAQLIKTSLNVTVRDETGNTVEGATVMLFENEEDYTNEANVAAQGVTDAKGYVKIKELKSIPYFIIVRKDDKDNAGGGEKTEKLEAKKINKVTVVIQ